MPVELEDRGPAARGVAAASADQVSSPAIGPTPSDQVIIGPAGIEPGPAPLSATIARSTATQVLFMVAGALAALVTLRVASRQFQPDGYGAVAAGLALVLLLSTAADLGLGTVAAREAARFPDEEAGIVVDLAVCRALLALVLVPVAIALGALIYGSGSRSYHAVLLLSPCLALTAVQAALGALFVARGRNGINVAVSLLGALSLLGAVLTIARLGLDTSAYALAIVGSEGIALLATAALLVVVRPRGLIRLPVGRIRALVAAALPLGVVQALNAVYFRADVVILGWRRPAAEVGRYSVAYQVVLLVMAMPTLFMTALLPALATSTPQRARVVMQRALQVSVSVALPILIVVAVAAPTILSIVSEAGFTAGAPALRWLAVGATISYATAVYGNSLIARGMQRSLVGMSVAVVAVNLALNLVLVPLWGAVGAGVAMASGEAVALVLIARVAHRQLGFRVHLGPLLPALSAAAAATAVGLWVDPGLSHGADLRAASWMISAVLGAYAVVLAACGGWRQLLPAFSRRG